MADLEFSLSDTNSSLFSAIRSLETGSPTGNYGEVAGIAVGAYQFTSITLKQLGAVKRVGFQASSLFGVGGPAVSAPS